MAIGRDKRGKIKASNSKAISKHSMKYVALKGKKSTWGGSSTNEIPSFREPIRHLMMFVDGTWVSANNETQLDNTFSNVYKLAVAINTNADEKKVEEYEAQIGFYLSGIGSGTRKLTEGIWATDLPFDVAHVYTNICLNYIADMGHGKGDKIYLFGFSRGALIARIVATLIARFGLLKQHHLSYFSELWDCVHKTPDEIDAFKRAHCHCHPNGSYEIKIEFLGLFDTVPGTYDCEHAKEIRMLCESNLLPRNIWKCVHILAADEDRANFSPLLWDGTEVDGLQILEHIWMPGAHSDIGGGYTNKTLGDVSLLTMLNRLIHYTQIGIDYGTYHGLQQKIQDDITDNVEIHYEAKKIGGVCPDIFNRKSRNIGSTDVENKSHQYASEIVDILDQHKVYRAKLGKYVNFNSKDFPIQNSLRIKLLG